MENSIKFPVIELTEWVFDEEEMFDEISCPEDLERIYELDEDLIPHFAGCHYVDSAGVVLKNRGHKVLEKKGGLFSAFRKPVFKVVFDIQPTSERMSLEDLKENILSKSGKNFLLADNEDVKKEYCESILQATTYEEVIRIATFMNEDE